MCLSTLAEARNNGLMADSIPKDRHLEITREAHSFRFVAWSEGFFCGGNSHKNPEQLVKNMQPLIERGFKPWAKTEFGCMELGHTSLSIATEINETVIAE